MFDPESRERAHSMLGNHAVPYDSDQPKVILWLGLPYYAQTEAVPAYSMSSAIVSAWYDTPHAQAQNQQSAEYQNTNSSFCGWRAKHQNY